MAMTLLFSLIEAYTRNGFIFSSKLYSGYCLTSKYARICCRLRSELFYMVGFVVEFVVTL
jgi:hypothetical protein